MAQQKYYPEEVLVEKMQSGEYGWLDYINQFFCRVAGGVRPLLWGKRTHGLRRFCRRVCPFQRRTIGSGYEIRQRITSNHHNIRL